MGIWFYVLFMVCRYPIFNLQTFFFMDLVVIAYVHIYENNKYTKKIERMMLMSQIAAEDFSL